MPCSKRLPETLVITAEYCLTLCDEGRAYVERLREAGVRAEYFESEGMIHAFLNLSSWWPDHRVEVYRRIGEFLIK